MLLASEITTIFFADAQGQSSHIITNLRTMIEVIVFRVFKMATGKNFPGKLPNFSQ